MKKKFEHLFFVSFLKKGNEAQSSGRECNIINEKKFVFLFQENQDGEIVYIILPWMEKHVLCDLLHLV